MGWVGVALVVVVGWLVFVAWWLGTTLGPVDQPAVSREVVPYRPPAGGHRVVVLDQGADGVWR